MKKTLFIFGLLALLTSCSADYEGIPRNNPQFNCADVYDKYFQYYTNTPPPYDTTWWLRLSKDTVLVPLMPPVRIFWVREVSKDIWLTMLQGGQPYPSTFCY